LQFSKPYKEGQDFVISSPILWNLPVMDKMFVSPQNTYVEILTLSVMGRPLKGDWFMRGEPS